MNYNEFKQQIKQNNKMQNYYQLLIHFTKEILLDISLRNQNRVAIDLGLTSVKFSHLLPLLKEVLEAELLLVEASQMDNLVQVEPLGNAKLSQLVIKSRDEEVSSTPGAKALHKDLVDNHLGGSIE